MKVINQLQYSLTDSRVFHDVKNITQSSLHPTQPNPWMDPTHDQLWVTDTARRPVDNRQDRYTAPLSLARSVINFGRRN